MITTVHRRGSSHRKTRMPCQDRFLVKTTERDNREYLMICADGHGGTPYVRSGVGAYIACRTAAKILSDELLSEEEYGLCIKKQFDRYIERHLKLHPLTSEEKTKLGENPEAYAYGTTLLAVKKMDTRTLVLQIGDGDICAIDEDGNAFPKLPDDPLCYGNITTSLVQEDAAANFRMMIYEQPAAGIALHTDGYDNISEGWDIFAEMIEKKENYTDADLQKEAAEHDHGDDQTIVAFVDDEKMEDDAFCETVQKNAKAKAKQNEMALEMELLMEQKNELSTFLRAAVEKYKRYETEEDAESFKNRSILPRYKEYSMICQRLDQLAEAKQQEDCTHLIQESTCLLSKQVERIGGSRKEKTEAICHYYMML